MILATAFGKPVIPFPAHITTFKLFRIINTFDTMYVRIYMQFNKSVASVIYYDLVILPMLACYRYIFANVGLLPVYMIKLSYDSMEMLHNCCIHVFYAKERCAP